MNRYDGMQMVIVTMPKFKKLSLGGICKGISMILDGREKDSIHLSYRKSRSPEGTSFSDKVDYFSRGGELTKVRGRKKMVTSVRSLILSFCLMASRLSFTDVPLKS